MKKFQVLTDSTSDVEKKFRDQYDFDYVMNSFRINDKEYDADLEWGTLSPEEYYDAMRNGNRSITSMIQTNIFEEKVKKYLDQGLDVLFMGCSSKLSGSVKTAEFLAKEILEKYPGRKIVCYDSLRSNYAEGYMAITAAKMALEGKDIDEVVKYFDEETLKFQIYATVGSLEWLKKAGRVKASTAFFGNLFGVKPIILGDVKGNNYAFKKEKGRKNALNAVIDIICTRAEDPQNHIIFIEHADCLEDAEYIKKAVEERIHPMAINVSMLGPIIGATTGPDTITVSFYGEKVTICGEE